MCEANLQQGGAYKGITKRGLDYVFEKKRKNNRAITPKCCCKNKQGKPCGMRIAKDSKKPFCYLHADGKRNACNTEINDYPRCDDARKRRLPPVLDIEPIVAKKKSSDKVVLPPQHKITIPEMKLFIESHLKKYKANEVVTKNECDIKRSSFERLMDMENSADSWLNDEVVNCYMELLRTSNPKIGFITSLNFATLKGINDSEERSKRLVRILKKQLSLDGVEYVFIPHFENEHWTLFVLNIKERKVKYYDSYFKAISRDATRVVKNITEYINAETYKHGVDKNIDKAWKWKKGYKNKKQFDAVSCGVFVIAVAKFITLNGDDQDRIDQSINQDVCKNSRPQIAYELLKQKLVI